MAHARDIFTSQTPTIIPRRAPFLGEHNEAVMSDCSGFPKSASTILPRPAFSSRSRVYRSFARRRDRLADDTAPAALQAAAISISTRPGWGRRWPVPPARLAWTDASDSRLACADAVVGARKGRERRGGRPLAVTAFPLADLADKGETVLFWAYRCIMAKKKPGKPETSVRVIKEPLNKSTLLPKDVTSDTSLVLAAEGF
jgi:hypothetical protein